MIKIKNITSNFWWNEQAEEAQRGELAWEVREALTRGMQRSKIGKNGNR